jgi:enoyl-CoA hydratase/carnithine racemase
VGARPRPRRDLAAAAAGRARPGDRADPDGRRVGADEALAIGLAELALPAEGAQDAAHELAARLAAGPGAVRRAPRLLRENLGRDRTAALAAEREVQLACLAGPDVTEAIMAQLEGRTPRFVGR